MRLLEGGGRVWLVAGVLLAVGVGLRIHNAIHYEMLWGFDALYNWRYIEQLTTSWALPAPDAGWSTAHPPLFYYASAALCRLMGTPELRTSVIALRLAIAALGLVMVFLAVAFVRRCDPENRPRWLLAGGLLLFLPVHIYMSAMLSEEIVVSCLVSIVVVGVALDLGNLRAERSSLPFVAGLGFVAGLASLTKLTGVLVALAAAGAYLVDGWRRAAWRSALLRAAVLLGLTGVVGGWFYLRNLIEYGYLYPHGLEIHQIMFTMPPGERSIADYFRLPLAIFSDPQLLHPDLLRSIWGSTFVTLWFDGHRVFLPTDSAAVTRVGGVILLLALLPTAAFGVGLVRGVRRALSRRPGPDAFLLLLVALTVSGYLLFTWRNPWFAVLKASFLLSLSVPFAYYTSEVLGEWGRRSDWVAPLVWGGLASLTVLIVGTFTLSELFWNWQHMQKPGVVW